MTLKILSSHAFDTEIDLIIILWLKHRLKQIGAGSVEKRTSLFKWCSIKTMEYQAHCSNHLWKVHFAKATSFIFQAHLHEMVSNFQRQGQKAWNSDRPYGELSKGNHLWRPHGGDQAQVDACGRGRGCQDPRGRPHRKLKLESTDVILSVSFLTRISSLNGIKSWIFCRYKLVI